MASGPLLLLDFANGVQETRLHDQRYFPDQIFASGPSATLLSWKYTTDAVGNITLIDDLLSPSDRVYGYLDYQVLPDLRERSLGEPQLVVRQDRKSIDGHAGDNRLTVVSPLPT